MLRLLILFYLLIPGPGMGYGFCQGQDVPAGSISVFDSIARLQDPQIELSTDLRDLLKDKRSPDYHPGYVTIRSKEESWSLPVQVRIRGHSRKDICTYPPLMFKFDSLTLTQHGLDPRFNKIKLVVPCRRGNVYENTLYREKLSYELYEIITPMCFRTRETLITLLDSRGKKEDLEHVAFLIEDYDQLSHRLGGLKYKLNLIHPSKVWDQQEAIMAMFQFMIGNTDWSITNMHNIKLVRSFEEKELIPVPYDFDYCGLVDAPYAVPFPKLPIKSVRQRLYLGLCRPEIEISGTASYFLSKKDSIFEHLDNFSYLDEGEKRNCRKYLLEFFDDLEDINTLCKKFRMKCID